MHLREDCGIDNPRTITLFKQVQEQHTVRLDAAGAKGGVQRICCQTAVGPGGVQLTRLSAAPLADEYQSPG